VTGKKRISEALVEEARELVVAFWTIATCIGGAIVFFTVLSAIFARRRDRAASLARSDRADERNRRQY
jgi:sugar phosphate permease